MQHMHMPRVRLEGDEQLIVEFYVEPIEDQARTLAEGRPIFRDVEHIRISGMRDAAGQTDNTFLIETYVNDNHRRRFAYEYGQFKNTLKVATDGMPLTMWPAVSRSSVKELAHVGLFTVEQLAAVEAKELRTNEWLKPLHEKAATWVKAVNDNGEVLRLEARVQELEKQVEAVTKESQALLDEVIEYRKAENRKKRSSEATT